MRKAVRFTLGVKRKIQRRANAFALLMANTAREIPLATPSQRSTGSQRAEQQGNTFPFFLPRPRAD